MKESGLSGAHFQEEQGKDKVRSLTHTLMANFMCQLGRATVPRYLVNHQSKCVCEGAF